MKNKNLVFYSHKGIVLEMSASLSFCGGNLSLIKLFDAKFLHP